jgi:predicted short-subunit dehydrogenase-like oxidoreductase (DUF2520 family)
MRELERDFPSNEAPQQRRGSAPRRAAVRDASLPSLAILGSGRVGGSLAGAASAAGLEARLAGRDRVTDACRQSGAALLCVPDESIAKLAAEISAAVPPLRFVGHTSGACSLEELETCRSRGASTYSLHPLQTVPDPGTDLSGAPCAVAGSDEQAEAFAVALAERLGMHPFAVPEERRAAYHAAASIASNFLVALEESAAELLGRAGVAEARRLLAPLVLRSAANWADRGAAALTGPIARGDEATVAGHREALAEMAPELLALYDALAERTAAIATEGAR